MIRLLSHTIILTLFFNQIAISQTSDANKKCREILYEFYENDTLKSAHILKYDSLKKLLNFSIVEYKTKLKLRYETHSSQYTNEYDWENNLAKTSEVINGKIVSVTEYEYFEKNKLRKVKKSWFGKDSITIQVHEYNEQGDEVYSQTPNNGRNYEYKYSYFNSDGKIESEIKKRDDQMELVYEVKYFYNKNGLLTKTLKTNKNGEVVRNFYNYNKNNQLVEEWDDSEYKKEINYIYDIEGQLIEEKSFSKFNLVSKNVYEYDDFKRILKKHSIDYIHKNQSNITVYSYHPNSKIKSIQVFYPNLSQPNQMYLSFENLIDDMGNRTNQRRYSANGKLKSEVKVFFDCE